MIKKRISPERVYELICEEHEHNPIVGTAFYETKHFIMKLGYSLRGADIMMKKVVNLTTM